MAIKLNDVTGFRGEKIVELCLTDYAALSALTDQSTHLNVSTKKADIVRLLQVPAPTYLLGVHEPSKRVFVRSVHAGIPEKPISRIPISYELTSANLRRLYNEVRNYWLTTTRKPVRSEFT